MLSCAAPWMHLSEKNTESNAQASMPQQASPQHRPNDASADRNHDRAEANDIPQTDDSDTKSEKGEKAATRIKRSTDVATATTTTAATATTVTQEDENHDDNNDAPKQIGKSLDGVAMSSGGTQTTTEAANAACENNKQISSPAEVAPDSASAQGSIADTATDANDADTNATGCAVPVRDREAEADVAGEDSSVDEDDEGEEGYGIRVHPHDVLFGNASFTNWPGNVRLQEWINGRREAFAAAARLSDQTRIARDVVKAVRSQDPPGRFLEQQNPDDSDDWSLLDDTDVFVELGKALRQPPSEPQRKPKADPQRPPEPVPADYFQRLYLTQVYQHHPPYLPQHRYYPPPKQTAALASEPVEWNPSSVSAKTGSQRQQQQTASTLPVAPGVAVVTGSVGLKSLKKPTAAASSSASSSSVVVGKDNSRASNRRSASSTTNSSMSRGESAPSNAAAAATVVSKKRPAPATAPYYSSRQAGRVAGKPMHNLLVPQPPPRQSPPKPPRKRSKKGRGPSKYPGGGAGAASRRPAYAEDLPKGVTMRPSGKWQAQIYFCGQSRYIGVFPRAKEAAYAYRVVQERIARDKHKCNNHEERSRFFDMAREAAEEAVRRRNFESDALEIVKGGGTGTGRGK